MTASGAQLRPHLPRVRSSTAGRSPSKVNGEPPRVLPRHSEDHSVPSRRAPCLTPSLPDSRSEVLKHLVQHLQLLPGKVRADSRSRSRHRASASVRELRVRRQDLCEPRRDERVRASILRLFLGPSERCGPREGVDGGAEGAVGKRRDFLVATPRSQRAWDGGGSCERTSTRMNATLDSREREERSLTRS